MFGEASYMIPDVGKRYIYDGFTCVEELLLDTDGEEEEEVFVDAGTLERVYVHGASIDEPLYCAIDRNGDRDVNDNRNDGGASDDAEFWYLHNRLGSILAIAEITFGEPDTVRVLEYYKYSVYGQVDVLPIVDDGTGGGTASDGIEDTPTTLADNHALMISNRSSSAAAGRYSPFGNEFLFTARRLDARTGLYYYRHRYYSWLMGRFVSRDPIGYAGGMNLYGYVGNGVVNSRDPFGLHPAAAAVAALVAWASGLTVTEVLALLGIATCGGIIVAEAVDPGITREAANEAMERAAVAGNNVRDRVSNDFKNAFGINNSSNNTANGPNTPHSPRFDLPRRGPDFSRFDPCPQPIPTPTVPSGESSDPFKLSIEEQRAIRTIAKNGFRPEQFLQPDTMSEPTPEPEVQRPRTEDDEIRQICHQHFVACRLTRLAELAATHDGVYRPSVDSHNRCESCRDVCIQNRGQWPAINHNGLNCRYANQHINRDITR